MYRVTPDVSPEVTLFARSEDGEEFISTQPSVDYPVTRTFNLSAGSYTVGLWYDKQVRALADVRVISPRH